MSHVLEVFSLAENDLCYDLLTLFLGREKNFKVRWQYIQDEIWRKEDSIEEFSMLRETS